MKSGTFVDVLTLCVAIVAMLVSFGIGFQTGYRSGCVHRVNTSPGGRPGVEPQRPIPLWINQLPELPIGEPMGEPPR